ncbi:MAG: MTAP family purine nucleoside phosphorylase [Desulfamplus sp.]|nr:MTAP family purine nucleoside phosphorylase [Desulfamplus sp.]
MNIGVITGSGFYDFDEADKLKQKTEITQYGKADIAEIPYGNHKIYFIARHGKNHSLLPNMINYRANITALKNNSVKLIIGTSIMGILDPNLPLSTLLLFNDIYFPENRLPSGEPCTFFTKSGDPNRGHYIFSSPFSAKANEIARKTAIGIGVEYYDGFTHCHAIGPRFNSKSEIAMFRSIGCSTISQTVCPEIILAGESEIAYCLLGFGVDYANGVMEQPTPVEVLNANMQKSKSVFKTMVTGMVDRLDKETTLYDKGFIYRFE